MQLVVDLISEVAIKHKKPFPSLHWLGSVSESVFLLDGGRTCILQLPSGGTRRPSLRYRGLYERLRLAADLSVSPTGTALAGVCHDGEVFIWHRDSNTLRRIMPPADFECFMPRAAVSEQQPADAPDDSQSHAAAGAGGGVLRPRLFVSAGCERALLVRPGGGPLLVWEDTSPSPRWSLVTPPDHVPLPPPHARETAVHVVFGEQSGDLWAHCALVFGSDADLLVTLVTLRWRPASQLVTAGQGRFSACWSLLRVPWNQLDEKAQLVRRTGALLARFSRAGHLLAVAVNQRQPPLSRLVYLRPPGGAVLAASTHGGGGPAHSVAHRRRRHQHAHYWLAGLCWLPGDALLAAVTRQGSLALFSALAEPVPLLVAGGLATSSRYLLLHPLVIASGSDLSPAGESPPSPADSDVEAPPRQRFSVSCHPRRPVLICSSGYMVTLVEVKQHAPLELCDQFISSARELLSALKRNEVRDDPARLRLLAKIGAEPVKPGSLERRFSSLRHRSISPGRRVGHQNDYVTSARRRLPRGHHHKRVSFSDRLAPRERRPAAVVVVEDPAHCEQLRQLAGRLMSAHALLVCQPGRATQQQASRATAVTTVVRQLSAAVLADGCAALGDRPARTRRLLRLLGQLAALVAFSRAGGHAVLACAGVLGAGVAAALSGAARLPPAEALDTLLVVHGALAAAEAAPPRPDQAAACVDPLERQEMAALFSVDIPAELSPCSGGGVLAAALGPLWRLLLARAGAVYCRQRRQLSAGQYRRLAGLLGLLQTEADRRRLPLAVAAGAARLPRTSAALRRYLAGDWDGAAGRLTGKLTAQLSAAAGQPGAVSRLAHGLLYLHVAGGRLRRALEATDDTLGRLAGGAGGVSGDAEQLAAALRDTAGRQLVRSLARLMARYHLPAPLAVPPPHVARPEPPLDSGRAANALQRSCRVSRDTLIADISSHRLADVWSPQHAFKLLLCCGLLSEAAWFARELGDWRTALLVCVLQAETQAFRTGKQSPAANGSPASELLAAQTACYHQLPAARLDAASLRHVLLAALLAGRPLLGPLLQQLCQPLRAALFRLPAEVPAGLPLPAVPLYMPAAGDGVTSPASASDVAGEVETRRQLSEAVQKAVAVMRAGGLLHRCVYRYLTTLRQTARQLQLEKLFRSPPLESSLEGVHRQLGALLSAAAAAAAPQEPPCDELAAAGQHLRHLCVLLYLLETRDRLAQAARALQVSSCGQTCTAAAAMTIATLCSTLRPLEPLAGLRSYLCCLCLDAALTAPADYTLAERLADVLCDLSQLCDAGRRRLLRLLARWRSDGDSGATLEDAEGWELLRRGPCDGSAAQRLLDSCRLRQLRQAAGEQRLRLQVEPEQAPLLLGCEEQLDPLEVQPEYLVFVRGLIAVLLPPEPAGGTAAAVQPPLLAQHRRWHEQHQLSSPAFNADFRKMLATLDSHKVSTALKPTAAANLNAGPAANTTASQPQRSLRTDTIRASRSAEMTTITPASTQCRARGLFRSFSFSDIWRHRTSAADERFLSAADGSTAAHRSLQRHRRQQRTRSAGAASTATGRASRAASNQSVKERGWQTLAVGTASSNKGGPTADIAGGGDRLSLKHPVFRLSTTSLAVPRLTKYERIEKLMGWFLLWRNREIRMDLVKPFSGPRIALRPSMPDILVYIWLTDRVMAVTGRGAGRGAAAGGGRFGRGKGLDSSSSDDFIQFDDDDLMQRRRSMSARGAPGRGGGAGYDILSPPGSVYGGQLASSGQGYDRQGHEAYGPQQNVTPGGGGNQGYGNRAMSPRSYGNQMGPNQDYGNHGMQPGGYGNQGAGGRGVSGPSPTGRGHSAAMRNTGYGGQPEYRGRGSSHQGRGNGGFDLSDNDKGRGGPRQGEHQVRFEGQRGPQTRSGGQPDSQLYHSESQMYHGGHQMQHGGPQMQHGGPQMQHGGPEMHYGGPEIHYGVPQMHYGVPHMQDGVGIGASASNLGVRSSKWGSWDDFRMDPVSVRGGDPVDRYGGGGGGTSMHTMIAPSPTPPPDGWQRAEPPPLHLPPGTPAGWGKTLEAVGCGIAGAQWKQQHDPNTVEGDECFMVYDDKVVRMENFTTSRGASIDVVEKVAVYSPLRPRSGPAPEISPSPAESDSPQEADKKDCVDCGWERWSASKLKSAKPDGGAAAGGIVGGGGSSVGSGGGGGGSGSAVLAGSKEHPSKKPCVCHKLDGKQLTTCESCEWKRWSASQLKSAQPPAPAVSAVAVPSVVTSLAQSSRGITSERALSGGAAASRSDLSMSRQSDRSETLTQLSDEVRQLRQEQRQLRRELAHRSRSASPASATATAGGEHVDVPELTRVIDKINDVLELGLERLRQGQHWKPRPIQAPRHLRPYIAAMGLPEPLLAAIVYTDPPPAPPPSRFAPSYESWRSCSSRVASPTSRPRSPAYQTDAGYRRLTKEQIGRVVATEVRKALREASSGRASSRRPRSTSPAPARGTVIYQTARRSHSADPNSLTSPPAEANESAASLARTASGSSTYRDYPFLLHVARTPSPIEEGLDESAVEQVRAVRASPVSRQIVELLHDGDIMEDVEPDLVERVLDVHNRGLAGLYEKREESVRSLQLLHADLSTEERESDKRTTREIEQLDTEIGVLKRQLRALESTETVKAWRSPSDEMQQLRDRLHQLENVTGENGRDGDATSAESGRDAERAGSAGSGSRRHTPENKSPTSRSRRSTPDRGSVGSPAAASRLVSPERYSPSGTRVRFSQESLVRLPDGGMTRVASPPPLLRDEAGEAQRPVPRKRQFIPDDGQPDVARSTPHAVLMNRPVRASQSVFATTGGHGTYFSESHSPPPPVVSTSDEDDQVIGGYVASDSDHRPPIPSSSVPSDPQFASAPSWTHETDSQSGVTNSMMKTYPSYLPPVAEQHGTAEEEGRLVLGPLEIGINPNSVVAQLASFGQRMMQAVNMAEEQLDYDEAQQLLQKMEHSPTPSVTSDMQPFSSVSSEPTVSMQQSLERRRQQWQQGGTSTPDLMFSAEDALLTADECDISATENDPREHPRDPANPGDNLDAAAPDPDDLPAEGDPPDEPAEAPLEDEY